MSLDIAVPEVKELDYTAEHTQVLRDAAHIRKRPDNYIPDTGPRGLHHLVYELVYNAVDEHLAGYCKNIHLTILPDGGLSVSDDGRGIPVEEHPSEKKSNLEVVMTIVGAGGKFDNKAYKSSAGLHGMGAKAVTALSETTIAEVRRGGQLYQMEFERGYVSKPLEVMGPATHTGTKISFWPDHEIFGSTQFEYDPLENRMRELAFLNRGLAITLKDERAGKAKEAQFKYEGGVAEYVTWLNRNEDALHSPIHILRTVDHQNGDGGTDQIRVEVAFQYTTGEEERVRCYANNQFNPNGGTHLTGFRKALTRVVNAYAEKEGLYKEGIKPDGKDFREGLTAVINVTLAKPHFESQTKIRLNNPEVDGDRRQRRRRGLGQVSRREPKGCEEDCPESGALRRAARSTGQGTASAHRPQEDPGRRRIARQVDGLHHPRPRRERAVPRRGRFRRRLRRERPRPPVSGRATPARQGAQRREGPARKALAKQGDRQPDRGDRRRHRQRRATSARSATARSSS